MHPPLETFIELEDKLARLLRKRWDHTVEAAWPAIEATWEHGNHAAAVALVGALRPPPLTRDIYNRIHALGVAMLSYGAEFVDKKQAAKWLDGSADLAPVDLTMRQLLTLHAEDAPAFAVRMLQTEAKRQSGVSLTPEDTKPLTDHEDYAAFMEQIVKDAATNALLGPSSYAARNVITQGGRWSSDLTANLTTSRLVNYGALDGMRSVGVRLFRIQATLDGRTSPICHSMNGKIFHVVDGFNILGQAMGSMDGNVLRVAHPWIPWNYAENVRTMSEAQLRANKWVVPPFHPRCRSIVVPAGRTQTNIPNAGVGGGGHYENARWESGFQGAEQVAAETAGLDMAEVVDGGKLMQAVRDAMQQLPEFHSWEIDQLGSLIGDTLQNSAVSGRLLAEDVQTIVSDLIRAQVPEAEAQGIIDRIMTELNPGGGVIAPTVPEFAGTPLSATLKEDLEVRNRLQALLDANANAPTIGNDPIWERVRAYNRTTATLPEPDAVTPEFWGRRWYKLPGGQVGTATEARTYLRERYAQGGVQHQKRLTIVTGPAAAGKSTFVERLALDTQSALIDGDIAKELVPEFAGGAGSSAAHEEGVLLAETVSDTFMKEGANVIYEKVGYSAASVERIAERFIEHGYTVDYVTIHVEPDEAMRRMVSRFLNPKNPGRYVDPRVIATKGGNRSLEAFPHIIQGGTGRSYTLIDATPPKGQHVILETHGSVPEDIAASITPAPPISPGG